MDSHHRAGSRVGPPAEYNSRKIRRVGQPAGRIGGTSLLCAMVQTARHPGRAAAAFTADVLAGADTVAVRGPAWGRWGGGRVIADLIVDGRSLAETLIGEGHGRAYDGGRREAWC